MKYCSVCAGAISNPFHQESWKDKCYSCYRKGKHKGWGDKERIPNLLKKHNLDFKLKDGREMVMGNE